MAPVQGVGAVGACGVMVSPLAIPARIRDEIVAHCQQAHPKEACGLLAAAAAGGAIVHVYPMRNVEDSPIGYSMDPKEQLQVEKQMRSRGQRLAAIYHSHTASAAYPSSVDVSLALSPDVSYVLVSLKDRAQPVFKSYRIDGQRIEEEPVIMASLPAVTVDVRDMTCAQALAVVAKAVAGLANGSTLDVSYNADDVKQDVLAWARERGHRVQGASPGHLTLQPGQAP
ncbi:MAG: M67 family metallopeptidase [Candidatus Omnitrophica bacterium]|nr:M67 family metallopeptidase [Candidatus Omnitrophota bacterium]